MRVRTVEKRLEAIQREMQRQIEAEADAFREKVIIPACKRLKCDFLSGNGAFFFLYRDDRWRGDGDAIYEDPRNSRGLRAAFEIMNIYVPDGLFGYWVESYSRDTK